MSDSSSSADSFGTFLETAMAHDPNQPSPSVAPSELLSILSKSGPKPVAELIASSGMDFTAFSQALKTMQDAGLVTLTGQPGNQSVELTEPGSRAAQVTTPS